MEQKTIIAYEMFLKEAGLSQNTILLYVARAKDFVTVCQNWEHDKNMIQQYVEHIKTIYRPRTVNIYIISLNRYLKWAGYPGYIVKTNRIQARRSLNNVLSIQEYYKLLDYAAQTGRKKYYMIMRVLAGTGIRVGELRYITVEAVRAGSVDVYNKGKSREIYIPGELAKTLLQYCLEEHIDAGILFEGEKGKEISRNAVWQMLNKLAYRAGVDRKKVSPHSFRHLFAKTYMNKYGNLAELGDILGHANLETTRIYTLSSIEEKRHRMDMLGI
ncbi:MAG: tyrosine-type recombinase/integrase [Clostridium sp.]|nr:tyrosine-type recombinase/integrase [Clostridium sp.]